MKHLIFLQRLLKSGCRTWLYMLSPYEQSCFLVSEDKAEMSFHFRSVYKLVNIWLGNIILIFVLWSQIFWQPPRPFLPFTNTPQIELRPNNNNNTKTWALQMTVCQGISIEHGCFTKHVSCVTLNNTKYSTWPSSYNYRLGHLCSTTFYIQLAQ